MSWKVEIIEDFTGAVIKQYFCPNEHQAEKMFDGVTRNLNHQKFSARIVEHKYEGLNHDQAK